MSRLLAKKSIAALNQADLLDAIARPWGFSLVDRILQVREKLESPELQVSIVGRFKSGKSTLINAILGDDLLPYDVLPCTACEVYIRYADQPTYLIQDEGDSLRSVGRDQLRDHVTAFGDDLAKRAEICVPHPLLKQGICLVDTPGFEDVNQTRSEVVFGVLPESDAIVMMFDASAIGDTEIRFLKERVFNSTLSRYIFVLNKTDLISESEVEEVREYLHELLSPFAANPKILTLSAKQDLTDAIASGGTAFAAGNSDGGKETHGLSALLGVIEQEILADREVIVAEVVDREVGSMAAWLNIQLQDLKVAVEQESGTFEEKVQRIEEEWKSLQAALEKETTESNRRLDEIVQAFEDRLKQFIAKLKPAIRGKIMAASLDQLKDPNRLPNAIEASFKEWMDRQIPEMEKELLGLFEDHDKALIRRIGAENHVNMGAIPLGTDTEKIEVSVIPALLIGGWFLLGWTNFIALAFATSLAGDAIKKSLVNLLVNENTEKKNIADAVDAKLDEMAVNLCRDITGHLRSEFKRRMDARQDDVLERINERRKMYVQAQESMTASSAERENKLKQLELDLVRLADLLPAQS